MEWEDGLDHIVSHRPSSSTTGYEEPVVRVEGVRGRPRFDISYSQLEFLSSLSFSWTKIASLLGVSRMTIYRRRVEFHMIDVGTVIHDYSDLISLVCQMKGSPHMG